MPQISFEETPPFHIEKKTFKTPLAAMNYHRAFELYYILHGEREYFIGDRFYRVFQGDLVLIPEGMLHRTAGKGATRFLMYFSKEFLATYFQSELLGALPLQEPFVFRADARMRETLERDLGDMLNTFESTCATDRAARAMLAARLGSLLLMISRAPNHYMPESFTDGRIAEVVRYINEHYSDIESIDRIAEQFYISKYHLCRSFTKNLGVPLITYLNTIKVRAAVRLMTNDKLNITEIATRCGFNSSSYFCKVFTGEMGMSPTAYRKRLR
ncbi:MAG: helix-turn-helix transcriptional regulator [Clostridia bacterium]|nr:helix-turn-helix transcriptional regulator [Clostridia bacterium]